MLLLLIPALEIESENGLRDINGSRPVEVEVHVDPECVDLDLINKDLAQSSRAKATGILSRRTGKKDFTKRQIEILAQHFYDQYFSCTANSVGRTSHLFLLSLVL